MKRILFIITLLVCGFIVNAQNPIPSDSSFPIKQSVANAPTTLAQTNVMQAKKGFINGVFTDTTQANLYSSTTGGNKLKYYPGAQIFTTSDNSLWLRDKYAKKWLRGSGSVDITSFTFDNDTTGIICFGNGICDTFSIVNLFNVVTNIVQNFADSTIYHYNDSTLIICTGEGAARVCDTIHLGSTNTYYFTVTGDTLITCDTVQTICPTPETCYQQELCDTIVLSHPPPIPVFQNGIQSLPTNPNIKEFGAPYLGNTPADLIHDTYIFTNPYQLYLTGRASGRPNFLFQQNQWSQTSSSILGINHNGAYTPTYILPDLNNPVNLYFNYTDRFVIPTQGAFTGDTLGFMYDRYGYLLMTNSQGSQNQYTVNDFNAKQVGIMFHTYDTEYTDAVTVFGNQVPSGYTFTNTGGIDSTLLDSRIAVFKTDKTVQVNGYPNTRDDGPANKALYTDVDGNMKLGAVIASTSIVEIISDTSIRVCNANGCDTLIVNITDPTVINIYNDTTLIICNEAGSCDTLTINNYTITNGSVVNIANTVFVAKSGNDATGVRQRLDLPFLTIKAALAAAFPGDVIVVYPGTYEETNPLNLAKSVNYHFIGKGELRLNTSFSTGSIFTDSSTVSYTKIWADHWTFNARSSQRVLNQVAASTVEMVADSLISVNGRTVNTASGARTTLTANYMYASGFLGGNLWIAGAYFYGDIGMIETEAVGDPVWLSNVASFTLHAKRAFSQDTTHADYIVHISDSNPTDSIFIDIDEIYSQKEWAIWAEGESQYAFITAKRISANSDCVVVSSLTGTGMLTVRADVIENRIVTTMDGIIHGEAGSITVIGAKVVRRSGATGADILTSNFGGQDGHVYLNSVSYDQTKVTEVTPGTIKRIDSLYYGSNFKFTNARLENDTAQKAAANNLELGRANVNLISGVTTINAIYTAGWQPGSNAINLIFSGAPLVKNNTAGGAGTATILLAGLTDFQAAAGDVLSLVFDGTNWREAARTLAASAGGAITADNAITASTATNVQWGATAAGANSPLLHTTYINTGGFTTIFTGANASDIVTVTNTSTGSGLRANSTSGNAVFGVATTGVGGAFNNNDAANAALQSYNSGGGLAGTFNIQPSSTNTVVPTVRVGRSSTGTPANGIGTSMEFGIGTTTTPFQLANTIASKWVDATHATRTSQMDFIGLNSGSDNTIMSAYGSGVVGIGISTAYTATRLNVVDDGLAGASMVKLTSSSTAATGNNNKVLDILTTGANANSTESTYGAYIVNSHSTNNSFNYGAYSKATGGVLFNVGFYGATEDANGYAFYGLATAGGGGKGIGINSLDHAIEAVSTNGLGGQFASQPSSTNSVITVVEVNRGSIGGAGADGIGGSIDFKLYTTTSAYQVANQIISKWTSATNASTNSSLVFTGKLAASTVDLLTLAGDGSVKLRPITATAASAITPAEGMLVFVSTTDATFISIGIWCYQNGAWKAL